MLNDDASEVPDIEDKMDSEFDEFEIPEHFNNYWRTKDGDRIKIQDMEDEHLVNTITFLRKNVNVYLEQFFFAGGEGQQERNPEMWDWLTDNTSDIDGCLNVLICQFLVMVAEAKRRGIFVPAYLDQVYNNGIPS